ncbi:hypothetical protein [Burkholderia sp. AU31652]|uniref:hypothetical protein n=1 Tax=Burkholderia sp. AU31652 TaxID=2015354 RepID=UPI0015C602F2|nr:hypothetical protein [Burkholderia sp. AU31652]
MKKSKFTEVADDTEQGDEHGKHVQAAVAICEQSEPNSSLEQGLEESALLL